MNLFMSIRLQIYIVDYNHVVHKICAINKYKKNKSKRQNLGKDKFYKAIKWQKFGGRNHIAKSAIFHNTWLTCIKNP
jgi:hypothetical protein